ncbi:class I SAM-dependent methyltransferase [Amycolatopsis sp. NEAU-NG30]|uniref:S-adenosyl-L-methionine-dependent methyltransferase n=1 Tax=Amycolatopsis melonis TaxID=3156488 RepID=A0ABV0LUQ8_9PSEU
MVIVAVDQFAPAPQIDDPLADAAAGGLDTVVILGAGFDTRAYRLPQLRGIPVYEVDLPAGTTRKAAALRKHFGRIPDGVTLVPVDFETQDFRDQLGRHGFTGGQRTLSCGRR